MHDTLALACYEVAHLLDGGRTGALQSDALGDFQDDVFQAHPFTVDVKRLYLVTEGIGGDGDDVQVGILQGRWGNALAGGEAAYEKARGDEETAGVFRAIGAMGVFPGDGVEVVAGGDEQDALRHIIKGTTGRCFRREKGSIEGFTVGHRIVRCI
jgi:hypothetical protein